MKIDDPQIVSLRAKVRAASEEFDTAMAFHEAWRPTAYDGELHARLGTSRATHTFKVVRLALRRETLMALMRLWDNDSRTPSLPSIANALGNGRIIDTLAAACEAHWATSHLSLDDLPSEDRAEIAEAAARSEVEFGRSQSDTLRQRAREAISLISSYAEGGARHGTLTHLRTLRDQHLAHRQMKPKPSDVEPADKTDEAVECFYQDMSRVIHLLLGVVDDADYRPEETAEIRRRQSELFWASVKGERTPGHPNYVSSPR